MTDVLVPVNGHLFSASALQQYADDAAREIAPLKRGLVKFGLDANGAHVLLIFTLKEGAVKLHTAVAVDRAGHPSVGAGGSISF
jgi:hypothetical protein